MTEIKTNLSQTKPDYYKSGKFDTIAFCQYHGLGFCEGNIIKYLVRAGKKGSRMHDLLKATEYLNRLVQEEVGPTKDTNNLCTIHGVKYKKHDQTDNKYKLACVHCLASPDHIFEKQEDPGYNRIVCEKCTEKETKKEPSGSTATDMFGGKYNKVITGTEGEYKELCDRCYANPIEMWESVKIPGFHLCDDCLKKITL